MADNLKLEDAADPSKPGEVFVRGTDALKPGAALTIFKRLIGRPATPAERAEYAQHVAARQGAGRGSVC